MDSPFLFFLLVMLCIGSALTTLVSFTLYIRARMSERAHPDEASPDRHRRQAALDRKERLYQSIHFISLLAFVVLGILLLVKITRRID
jgi:hypothetical protein